MRQAINRFLLASILLFPTLLISNQEEINQAEDFAKAGDPDGSISILESMIDPSIDEWQRRRIKYDAGTAYLYSGDWKQAIAKLQTIAAESSISPILEQRLIQNLAYARLLQANDLWNTISNGSDQNEDAYYSLLILLKQLSLDIEKGRKAQCTLLSIEGAQECPNSAVYDEMEREYHRLHSIVITSYDKFRTENASLQLGVPELISSIQSFLTDLSLFNEVSSDAQWRDSFRLDLLSQMHSWNTLWDRLQPKWKSQTDGDTFEVSYQHYADAQIALKNGDSAGTISSLKSSAEGLEKLLKNVFNTNSLQDSVAKLLTAYKLALIKDPIQYASLTAVLEAQTALASVLSSSTHKNADPFIKNAQTYLKKSVESYHLSKSSNTRLYAEAAMSFIKGLEQQLFPVARLNGESLLEQSISMQELVKRLTLLRFQSPLEANEMKDIDQLIVDLQTGVVDSAKIFPEAVIAQQRLIYDDPGNKDDRCQCTPWDDVVPLYDDGYVKARQAAAAFSDPTSRPLTVMLQSQAIEYWKEALAAFHQPKKKKSEEKVKENQEHRPETSEANLNDILRFVEQMEKDDKSRSLASPRTGSGSEDRPW